MEPALSNTIIATVSIPIETATSTLNLPLDLKYLLFLQEWRISIGGVLDSFMQGVSHFAISVWLPMAIAIFYWCFNKKLGSLIFLNVAFGDLINSVVKMSCCIYRPWIRSSAIKPAGDAIKTAGGYSFPSGHTECITSYFATIAALTWLKKRWVSILCLLPIIVVGFSRNYLGVHTPEDVVVGFLLCCAVIAFNFWIFEKLGKDRVTDTKYFIGGLSFALLMLVYFVYKNYPVDYKPDGSLIVDPQKMMKDAFGSVGRCLGLFTGWYIETQFIKFMIFEKKWQKFLCGLFGIIFLYCASKLIPVTFYSKFLGLGDLGIRFWRGFVPFFFIMGIYPVFIKLFQVKFMPKEQLQSEEEKSNETVKTE